MSGDPIDEYLSRLRASLRTPPEQTEQILAEAEDHLRESAVAGEALGVTERDAQEAAIAAFGPVQTVVRAHRRPAAVAAELCLAACKMAAIYLLVVAGTGVLLAIADYWLAKTDVLVLDGRLLGPATSGRPAALAGAYTLGGCAVAGLVFLACYVRGRRFLRRSRPAREALPGGYFPLFAAIFMLVFGPVVVIVIAIATHPSGAFVIPAVAAVVGSIVVALGYAVRMARTIIRQGRNTGTNDRGADYA